MSGYHCFATENGKGIFMEKTEEGKKFSSLGHAEGDMIECPWCAAITRLIEIHAHLMIAAMAKQQKTAHVNTPTVTKPSAIRPL